MPLQRPATPRGFSVMELMIVVTILLILAAIEIRNLMRASMAADQAAAVNNEAASLLAFGAGHPCAGPDAQGAGRPQREARRDFRKAGRTLG